MAEENEKNDNNEQSEQEAEEASPEASAEEAAPEQEAAEEPAGNGEAESDADPAEPDAGATEAETTPDTSEDVSGSESGDEGAVAEDSAGNDVELTPKQRRKLERSRASGPAGPQRSPEERASERRERRTHAAEERGRHRRRLRERRGEPSTGTPAAERVPGKRKIRLGTVVSSRAAKTITVRIERARRDPTYEKVVRRSGTVHAHDERDEANEGDVVRVIETRPLSRTKRWRLLEIVERAR